jgi:hypothetical protein
VCRNCPGGSLSPVAIGDHPPARSGAFPSVCRPPAPCQEMGVLPSPGHGHLGTSPRPLAPAPRNAFLRNGLRATSSVSIGGHGACAASGWPTFSPSSMPNALSCQHRISSQTVTHAPPRPSWPSIRPSVGGGNSRRKGLTRRRLKGSQYEPCRALYASWHQRLGGLPWARHELGTKRTLLMVGHKVGNQC